MAETARRNRLKAQAEEAGKLKSEGFDNKVDAEPLEIREKIIMKLASNWSPQEVSNWINEQIKEGLVEGIIPISDNALRNYREKHIEEGIASLTIRSAEVVSFFKPYEFHHAKYDLDAYEQKLKLLDLVLKDLEAIAPREKQMGIITKQGLELRRLANEIINQLFEMETRVGLRKASPKAPENLTVNTGNTTNNVQFNAFGEEYDEDPAGAFKRLIGRFETIVRTEQEERVSILARKMSAEDEVHQ